MFLVQTFNLAIGLGGLASRCSSAIVRFVMALPFVMPFVAWTPILGASARPPHFDELWRSDSRRLGLGSSAARRRSLDNLSRILRFSARRRLRP